MTSGSASSGAESPSHGQVYGTPQLRGEAKGRLVRTKDCKHCACDGKGENARTALFAGRPTIWSLCSFAFLWVAEELRDVLVVTACR